jgi:hypothetical protein
MATYPPPTEQLPIFDDTVFTTLTNDPLTYDTAKKYFLSFPNAQGTENLQTTNVSGLLTCNANAKIAGTPLTNYLEFPDNTRQYSAAASPSTLLASNNTWVGTNAFNNVAPPTSTSLQPAFSDSSTKMPTTAWVQTAITNGTSAMTYNLNGGLGGYIPYQSANNTTSFLANGTAGQVLQSNGTTLAPSWTTNIGGNAATSTVSASCSGNSATATTATNALACSGNSATATQVRVTSNTNNAVHYLTFSDTNSAPGAFIDLHTHSGITCNPSGNTITATTFNGALNGNANTATSISGGASGDLLYQSASSTTSKLGIGANTYVLTSNGSAPVWTSPSVVAPTPTLSAVLTAGNSAGTQDINMNGNDINNGYNINSVFYNLTDLTTTATDGSIYANSGVFNYDNNINSGTHNFAVNDAGGVQRIPLTLSSSQITCGVPINLNSNNITNGGTITATTFNGTATQADAVKNYDITFSVNDYAVAFGTGGSYSAMSSSSYMLYSPSTNTIKKSSAPGSPNIIWDGNATTATTASTCSGNSLTATTASKVALTNDNTSGTYLIPFAKSTSSSEALYVDNATGPLTYNPSTSTLTATTFSGALNGNASSASLVNVSATIPAGVYNIPVCSSTGNQQLRSDLILQYDTTVSPPNITADLNGKASSAVNIAGGGAGRVPYNTGSSATSFTAVGTAGQVLQSNGTGAPTWTTNIGGNAATATTATNANNVNISNTASGATNYVLLSTAISGNAPVLTDTSGLTYNSTTNTLVANITGSAGSAPMPFVPKFNNASWFQNSSSGYTGTLGIQFNGTWNQSDFIVFRVNALMFWGGTYPTNTWTSYGRTSGTIQIRPAAMPAGVWSPVSAPVTNWATNGGSYTGITTTDICFYWQDGGGGTLTNFYVYGIGKYFEFLFTDPGVPWYSGISLEYLYSFSSGGGTHTIATPTVGGGTFVGYNNSLPN